MRAILLAGLAAAGALVSGCGPDCDGYCRKLLDCSSAGLGPGVNQASCLASCNAVGSDEARTIRCVISHTCTDIFVGGRCSLTGRP